MKPLASLVLILLPAGTAAWLAAPRSGDERDGPRIARPAELFPVPATGLRIRGADDPKPSTPREVLDDFSRCVGVTLHVLSEADRLLDVQDALGLNRTLDVPREQVWSVVEGFVSSLGLAFEFEHRDAPRVLRVLARSGFEGRTLADHALLVDEADLAEWATHPAWMLTLPMQLDAGSSTEIHLHQQHLWSGLAPQRVEPVGEKRMLVLAFGDTLPRLARIVRLGDVAPAPERR